MPGIAQKIDFVVDHPQCGKVLLEVKDIENAPLTSPVGSAFDPYRPIRTHIDAAKQKFKNTPGYLCVLVIAVPPGSFVMLDEPTTVMGAMYGDHGFRIGLNPEKGTADPVEPIFIPGKGKMIRKNTVQNKRIAAIVTVTEHNLWNHAMKKYINTDGEWQDTPRTRRRCSAS